MLAGHDVEPKLHLILDPDPRSPRLTNPVHEQGLYVGLDLVQCRVGLHDAAPGFQWQQRLIKRMIVHKQGAASFRTNAKHDDYGVSLAFVGVCSLRT